jgi:pimeloyl-ACP methyl ester carboxylesterase
MSNASSLTTPAESFAEVRAHDQVMRYRRAGSGRPLLVLRTGVAGDSLWHELDDRLPQCFRVLTPDTTTSNGSTALWLRGFLEGIGVERTSVLATGDLCMAALELALMDGDRIERLALVPPGGVPEPGLDGALATSMLGITVPLLVVRRGVPSSEALPQLMRFLEGDGHAK